MIVHISGENTPIFNPERTPRTSRRQSREERRTESISLDELENQSEEVPYQPLRPTPRERLSALMASLNRARDRIQQNQESSV